MNSDDPEFDREHVHTGHDLESGLLERVREWTDAFPWLRLTRTLRAAASPPLLLVTAIVFLVWWFGVTRILGGGLPDSIDHLRGVGRWPLFFTVTWSLIVWSPAALLLARQGALLTANRTMLGIVPGLSHAARRTPSAWVAAAVPAACVLAIGSLIVAVGWLARLFGDLIFFELIFALVASAIAIPCGMLAFGGLVAVPLSWSALANERDPDPLDSLSRGYESLFRRPLPLVVYLALSLGIMAVVWLLASGVAVAAAGVSTFMLALSGCSPTVPLLAQQILQCFPAVVLLTLGWSLIGGIYLLLRYDTGGQQVEDLWQGDVPATSELPKVPTT